MSISEGIDVAMVSSVRVAAQAPRTGGSARAAETAELAGRFTAMLESLNGVSQTSTEGTTTGTAASVSASAASDRPVALGAVSLLALNEIDAGTAAETTTTGAPFNRAVALDARWLATLHNDIASGEDGLAAD